MRHNARMRWTWLVCAALGLLLAPTRAWAIEVMCQNDMGGSCTVSNDPSPMFDCTCDGAPAGGTTGGSMNPWADYTEAELLEVCNDSLPTDCAGLETTAGTGGGDTDPGTGPVSESTPDSDPSTDPSGPGESGESPNDSDGGSSKSKGCAVAGHAPVAAVLLVPVLWWRRRG